MILRGVVTDNQDPMERGRVRVQIWGVHDEKDENLPWAEVMGSTAFPLHQGQGVASVIPVDATVWVGFEHNDLNCPVVFGIFVGHQADTMDQANPGNSDFQGGAGSGSDYGTKMSLNVPGAGKIEFDTKNGTMNISNGAMSIGMDAMTNAVKIGNGIGGIEMIGNVIKTDGIIMADKVIETGGLGGLIP